MQLAQAFQAKSTFKEATIQNNLTLQKEAIFVLSDGTAWKLHPAKENTRSISQWWSGVKLEQPDPPFLFSPSSWRSFAPVTLFFYNWESLGLEGNLAKAFLALLKIKRQKRWSMPLL